MKQIKFDNLIENFLSPSTLPATKPKTAPAPTPSKPKPSTPNPDPFRRHKPGQMPKQRPMASSNLKSRIQSIVKKYMTIAGQ